MQTVTFFSPLCGEGGCGEGPCMCGSSSKFALLEGLTFLFVVIFHPSWLLLCALSLLLVSFSVHNYTCP